MKYAKWLLCLLPFAIGYLMGSFIVVSWDINQWDAPGRGSMVMMCFIFSVAIGAHLITEDK